MPANPDIGGLPTMERTLQGTTVHIPNLRSIFAHWPQGQHKDVDSLRQEISLELSRNVRRKQDIEMIQQADLVSFAARSWPNISTEDLKFFIHLVIWAGITEDYIEKLTPNTDESMTFHASARIAWKHMFQLDDTEGPALPQLHPLISSLDPFAKKICDVYNQGQRESFFSELINYVDGTEMETLLKHSNKAPTYEEYMALRFGSIGFGFLLSLSEFACGKTLPNELRTSPQWKVLQRTAVFVTFMINDLCSAKREIVGGEVFNSVIIRAKDHGSFEQSVDECVQNIKNGVRDFDQQAKDLVESAGLGSDERLAVSEVINTMRVFIAGGLEWSLRTQRYGIAENILEDGSIVLSFEKPQAHYH